MIQTRFRHNCVLNKDLFRCNIIDSVLCSCGKLEGNYYFSFCTKYSVPRNEVINAVIRIDSLYIVDTHVCYRKMIPKVLQKRKYIFQHTII